MGYKIFSFILLNRLKAAGVEDRIFETQYDFKSKSGSRDAIFIIRRFLDQCAMGKDKQMVFLALDWARFLIQLLLSHWLLLYIGLEYHLILSSDLF